MLLADLFLDILFGIDRRLRERQLEIENARREQIRKARQDLLDEMLAADAVKRPIQ